MDLAALIISIATLAFYLFQEYKEVFTLYFFSNYDYILIPSDKAIGMDSDAFVLLMENCFKEHIELCRFKHVWVGYIRKTYYGKNINGDDYRNEVSTFSRMDREAYFTREFLTHKGRKRMKTLRKTKSS